MAKIFQSGKWFCSDVSQYLKGDTYRDDLAQEKHKATQFS